jgi:DNA-binding MarR family transcriptional regulator
MLINLDFKLKYNADASLNLKSTPTMSVKTLTTPLSAAAPFELDTAPGHLIRRAHQLAVAQFGQTCAAFDLTSVQFGVLTSIAQQDGIDQSRLSIRLALDAVTVGSVLLRLESKHLIERRVDQADKRRKCLHITPTALQILSHITPHALSAQQHILSPLNEAEQIEFIRLITQLIQGLEEKQGRI